MINFKNKDEALPSALILAAIVTLAATFAYMILVPKPTVAGVAKGRQRSVRQIEEQIEQAKTRSKESEALAATRVWDGNQDEVLAQVLAQLTVRAQRSKVTMAAFRPQKPLPLTGVTELPCSVQVSGPYETVLAFLGTLDEPSSRVALRSVSVASSDGATSAVTATLGVSVYCQGGAPADEKAGAKPRATAAAGGAPRG